MHIIAPRSGPIPQIETYGNFKAYRTMLLGLLVELVLKQLRWIPVKLQLYYRDARPLLLNAWLQGPMLETLDHTIRIGSTPTVLYFDLYLHSAYAAHYVYLLVV